MAIYFKKPDLGRNWKKTLSGLALALADTATTNVSGAIERLGKAAKIDLEHHTVEERAWIWLHSTLSAGLRLIH
ncbi:MAG: hypothetical protein AAF439_01355 [Pseudomonadota bacterium]